MFQTSDDDAWLIPLFARHATRPITSSLFTEVYKQLPNDTDFTIFKKHGVEGYNFAFVRDVSNYHTRNDNFETANRGSLQHHGEHAWRMLNALADFDVNNRTPGQLIYTDVLGQFILWWPAAINIYLAGGILAGTVLAGVIARVRGLFSAIRWRVHFAVPLMFTLAILASVPCAWVAGFREVRAAVSVENGVWILLLYWTAALSLSLAFVPFTALANVDSWSAWLGTWLHWNTIGFAAAWFLPGLSYLFLLPGLIAIGLGLLAALAPKRLTVPALLASCFAGPVVAALFWLPMQVLLYDGVGFMLPPIYPVCAGLLTMTVVPLVTGMPVGATAVPSPGEVASSKQAAPVGN
jgi:hypothetical protein